MATLRDAAKNMYDLLRRRWNLVPVHGGTISPTLACILNGHPDRIGSISFLPDSKHLVSGSDDGIVRKWRVSGGCQAGKAMNHASPVNATAVSPNGKVVASGGDDGKVIFWSTDTCEKIVESQEQHMDWIWSLSFAPDSQTVASGSLDGSIILWSASTGKHIAGPFEDSNDWVLSVAFSPSGDKIASRSGDGQVVVRNIRIGNTTSQPIRMMSGSFMRSVVWSLDSRQVICGGRNGKIKFFDSSNGAHLTTCRGHIDAVTSMALSLDGTFLASASLDCTVRLWSTSTHQQLACLEHPVSLHSLSVSSDGRYLVSGGDTMLCIWQLQDVHRTSKEGNNPAASDTDPSSPQLQHVNSDIPEHTLVDQGTAPNDEVEGQESDLLENSGTGEGDGHIRTAARDSYLDLPAVLPSRTAVVDGACSRFFGQDDPATPQSDNGVHPEKQKKKVKISRQHLYQQLKHFRDGVLTRHGPSDMSSTSRPSTSQKLKDHVSRIRRRTSFTPEDTECSAQDRRLDQRRITQRKSLRVTLVSAGRLQQRVVVASNAPPAEQEKVYLVRKDGKLVLRHDLPPQATTQTQRLQPTLDSSTIPGSSTATQGRAQGLQVSNDDYGEVCGCCGYFIRK